MPAAASEISVGRKVLAGAAMAGAAGIVAREAVSHYRVEWMLLAFAVILAASGIGMTRRSLIPQVVSRGAAWLLLLPASLITAYGVLGSHGVSFELAGLAATTGAALLLARPMLHTKEARAEFAPKTFRRWLLGGSIANASAGFVAGGVSLSTLVHEPLTSASFGVLALSLFASAIAVVRMRAWGIFLGALTSTMLLASGLFSNTAEAVALALLAAPALLMHLLPVLVARWSGRGSNLRVSDAALDATIVPTRYRIATDDADELDAETAEPRATRTATLRA